MKDGGAAFPLSQQFFENDRQVAEAQHSGMSLRDWFAGQALAGYIADPSVKFSDSNEAAETNDVIAARCYSLADAMLAEREKGGSACE
jgi:hypothetical protein